MLKRSLWIIILAISFVGCDPARNEEKEKVEVKQDTAPELIWSEEFDYEGAPDPEKWGYREGGHGWGNNEAQNYTTRSENVIVKGGNLVITAQKEDFEGSEYTSGAILTYGKQDFHYGRIEVRAKLPGEVGTWPAIWLLGNSIREGTGWPECGEIDIMENVGFDPDTVHANVHTKAYNHVMGTNKGNRIFVANPGEYHIYSIDWFEDHIDFFIDGKKYFSFDNESEDTAVWPFSAPHFLIINLAIGGSWGGQQGIDDSKFPHRYMVDYVRYYKL